MAYRSTASCPACERHLLHRAWASTACSSAASWQASAEMDVDEAGSCCSARASSPRCVRRNRQRCGRTCLLRCLLRSAWPPWCGRWACQRHPRAGRRSRSIEIAAKRDDTLPAQLQEMVDMVAQLVECDISLAIACTIALVEAVRNERTAVVDADKATKVSDGLELPVREVAGMFADGTAVGMGCHEGPCGMCDHILEAGIVQMRDVGHDMELFHAV